MKRMTRSDWNTVRAFVNIVISVGGLILLVAMGSCNAEAGAMSFLEELAPTKWQVFSGVGITVPSSEGVDATTTLTGVAALYKIDAVLLRPFAALGTINPDKSGIDTFFMNQVGLSLVVPFQQRFAVVIGAAATWIHPKSGAQFLPTAVAATATTLRKTSRGNLQLLTPVAYNKKGFVLNVQLAWLF